MKKKVTKKITRTTGWWIFKKENVIQNEIGVVFQNKAVEKKYISFYQDLGWEILESVKDDEIIDIVYVFNKPTRAPYGDGILLHEEPGLYILQTRWA